MTARRVVGWVLVLAALGAWWFTLAPTRVGGPATFVVVVGESMEPRWYTGDVVVTRRAANYAVGDVVAFRTDAGTVIHRVVDGDAERGFTTQGDNRTTPDTWTTRPSDVLGREWFTLPVGIAVLTSWGPIAAGVLVFVLLALPGPGRDASASPPASRTAASSVAEPV